MTAPIITIGTVDKVRISAKTEHDTAVARFTASQALTAWEARADGTGRGSGLLVGSDSADIEAKWQDATSDKWCEMSGQRWQDTLWPKVVLSSGATGVFEVEDTELTNGDKTYRINVYGRNKGGEWSGYES